MTTDTETEIVEGELVPYEPAPPITLFGTSDPRVALDRMSDLAKVLVDIVRSQKLSVRIRGGEYLRVEAWRALGGMVGVHPITAWSKPNESGDGYLVRVEACTRAGEIVGASEAECSRAEELWATRDPHAVRAMAETRATSRALRGPLGQIVVLAGYNATAAEEMPVDGRVDSEPAPQPSPGKIPPEHRPTDEQREEILTLVRTLERINPDVDWTKRCRELAGVDWNMTTRTIATGLIERLQAELRRFSDAEEPA